MNLKNMKVRLPMYLIGLFIMTIGIAISVKSNLGVSPVSSIPYTMTCIWGIEMGKATILFHIVLVLIQLIILRKNFKLISLLQIPVGVVFGYFTTFCNYLASFLPDTDNLVICHWINRKNLLRLLKRWISISRSLLATRKFLQMRAL